MPASELKFSNPPVKEAILGIRFSEPIPLDTLWELPKSQFFKEKFRSAAEWTAKEERKETGASSEQASATVKRGGLFFQSQDNNRQVQVNPTQITFHNLNKYDGWEEIYSDFQVLWDEFCKSVGKQRIQQVNVRYVNQIVLPYPFEVGLQEYITILPLVPPNISTSLNNFFIQLNIPGKTKDFQATITETILLANEKHINFLLDLIVVRNGIIECDDENVWQVFSDIRKWKNELFEQSITEKTKKLFNNE